MLLIIIFVSISGVRCESVRDERMRDEFTRPALRDEFTRPALRDEFTRPALDINELFPSFNESEQYAELPATAYRNISIDISKLDINKFKHKMMKEIRPKLAEEENSAAANARRFMIVWYKQGGDLMYYRGYKIMVNQLHCDMILQLIYMAKGQITSIENNPNVNTADTGYRTGFVSHKCRRIYKKLGRILGFMKRWQFAVFEGTGHIVLHHRAVRLHVDFLYYYWVVQSLDARYRQRFGDKYRPRLPQGEEHTGGISIEMRPPS